MGKSPKRANWCHLYQKKSEGEMEECGSKGPSNLPWSPPLKVKEAHAGVPTQMTTTRLPHSAPDAGHWACLGLHRKAAQVGPDVDAAGETGRCN